MSAKRICYVTGTRAEFGLMQTALHAIRAQPGLELKLIATGMHLSAAHGQSVRHIYAAGFEIEKRVPWRAAMNVDEHAIATADATSGLAYALRDMNPDIVLVCGDRVEAFAAASAAHIGGRIVAHVHGGDRAMGQVDDALRHAITKLAHIHLPATAQSAKRLHAMGEDRWRIHRVGTPGLDGIRETAAANPQPPVDVLVVLHPDSPDESQQFEQTRLLVDVLRKRDGRVMIVYPNNDPGWHGIARALESVYDMRVLRDLPRERFLGLLAASAVLVGNSSAGIIEAASLGTPVVNIGDRQLGRERSGNLVDVPWKASAIAQAIASAQRRRYSGKNVYGGGNAGARIARVLSDVPLDEKLRKKLIRY
jgi:GDP/UDP-N,N'-diacetylbacillosamine 2-epimerase (hydrolysing)